MPRKKVAKKAVKKAVKKNPGLLGKAARGLLGRRAKLRKAMSGN